MPILPFLFMISAIPIIKLKEITTKQLKINKNVVLALMIVVFIILSIPSYNFGNKLIDSKKTSYEEVKEVGLWMKENSNPGDSIVSASYPQITYYSERSTFTYDTEGNPELKNKRNKTEFDEFVQESQPRYFMISLFESHPKWIFQQGTDKSNIRYMNLTYFNSSILFNDKGQVINLDLKEQISKDGVNYTLIYPREAMRGIFIYEAKYL